MKTKFYLLTACVMMLCALNSCIKDEPLYMEAEIEDFKIDDPDFINAKIDDDAIQVIVATRAMNLRNVTPKIHISPKAKITPSLDEPQDLTRGVTYTVTSEDGTQTRSYFINIIYPPASREMQFDFEKWSKVGFWQYPSYNDPDYNLWESANNGVGWAFGTAARNKYYPTRDTTDAYSGIKAALLETIKGKYISIVKMNIPIFPGSLYTGRFSLNQNEPLKSTLFGQPHPKESGKPVKFEGYYKYKPGSEFMVDEVLVPGKIDEFDIYAMLYKVEKGADISLDGSTMNRESEYCVALADVEDKTEKGEYTKFSVPFLYREKVDYTRYDYKLAIILASSARGAHYEGAIGSMLTVDELKLIFEDWENDEKN